MSGSFTVDESRWPIAVFAVEGVLSDAQVDAFTERGEQMLERGEPYAVIFDMRRMRTPSAYSRARTANWSKTNAEKLRARCLGAVYVVESPILRFVTMTVLLLAPLPMPYAVRKDVDEALSWVRERMAR